MKTTIVVSVFVSLAFVVSGCDSTRFMGRIALKQQVGYFHTKGTEGSTLERLSERVYTFNWHFDRAIIVDTDEGLVITDPFNEHMTRAMLQALKNAGIDKPVHTVIYTHFHVDHVRGAGVLNPQNVIAHKRCEGYWKDLGATGIMRPTEFVEGDVQREIGGVTMRLISLGMAHTDTNYAVYFPKQRALYLADMVGGRVFLPVGGIALYVPGYFRALEQLKAIDFEIFVPSHFAAGKRQDFLDAVAMQQDLRRLVAQAMTKHDGPIPTFMDEDRFLAVYDEVYPVLRARYGDWHGFDSQVLPSFLNQFVAEYVGN